jgi:alcohol dehydrogenase
MVTGHGERDHDRLSVARQFGADLVVDAAREDPVTALQRVAGRGADVVVDVTAKAPDAFAQALRLARPGGTIVVAGTRGATVPDLNVDLVVYKELRVLGALGVDVAAYRAALELLASGTYPFAGLERRTAGFDDLSDLLQDMAAGRFAPLHGVFVPG